ncbi:hypothetical protein F4778DRAFT_777941 [Xylariomycetidae sp. FL2044]|nr:hypothetical protein F4778DRAFT_777941 [Xylariomycetidae sp. FL2044]
MSVSSGWGGAWCAYGQMSQDHDREFYNEARRRHDEALARGEDPFEDFKKLVEKTGPESRMERAYRRMMDQSQDEISSHNSSLASLEANRTLDTRAQFGSRSLKPDTDSSKSPPRQKGLLRRLFSRRKSRTKFSKIFPLKIDTMKYGTLFTIASLAISANAACTWNDVGMPSLICDVFAVALSHDEVYFKDNTTTTSSTQLNCQGEKSVATNWGDVVVTAGDKQCNDNDQSYEGTKVKHGSTEYDVAKEAKSARTGNCYKSGKEIHCLFDKNGK